MLDVQRKRYGGISPPLESFKNVLPGKDGFWGPAGKLVAELAAQKLMSDLGGSKDVFICTRFGRAGF